jgi:hypothetical protein
LTGVAISGYNCKDSLYGIKIQGGAGINTIANVQLVGNTYSSVSTASILSGTYDANSILLGTQQLIGDSITYNAFKKPLLALDTLGMSNTLSVLDQVTSTAPDALVATNYSTFAEREVVQVGTTSVYETFVNLLKVKNINGTPVGDLSGLGTWLTPTLITDTGTELRMQIYNSAGADVGTYFQLAGTAKMCIINKFCHLFMYLRVVPLGTAGGNDVGKINISFWGDYAKYSPIGSTWDYKQYQKADTVLESWTGYGTTGGSSDVYLKYLSQSGAAIAGAGGSLYDYVNIDYQIA